MAKEVKVEAKIESPREHKKHKEKDKVVETTKVFVKDNLLAQQISHEEASKNALIEALQNPELSKADKEKLQEAIKWHEARIREKWLEAEEKAVRVEEKKLEKEEKRLENIEKTAHAAKEETERLIADKEKQLAALEAAEKEVEKTNAETKVKITEVKKTEKKSGKWTFNPRYWVTNAASGILGFPSRVVAKLKHIVARPQQLVSAKLYKDLAHNALMVPGNIVTGITGMFYKPHREKFRYINLFKNYWTDFSNPTNKSKVVRGAKKALWLGGKVAAPAIGGITAPVTGWISLFPKFFANIGRGLNHVIHETLEGIHHSKFSLNPKKWWFKYAKTKEAFQKAFSWNKKWTTATSEDVVTIFDRQKKAA